jgi:hypothetical protein
MGYAASVSRLLACPFCRALFAKGETDGTCPQCGVRLEPMHRLPPSPEALDDQSGVHRPVAADEQVLPWTYLGRGRGALLALALLGLVTFFLPWVQMTKPELVALSGYDLACGRAGWLWGGATAWLVTVPLVLTRRTFASMRGVRVITTLFCAMTLGEVLMLIVRAPQSSAVHKVTFDWGVGLHASAVASVLGVFFAVRFGVGPQQRAEAPAAEPARTPTHTGNGQTLH